jgi:hypothetical protein
LAERPRATPRVLSQQQPARQRAKSILDSHPPTASRVRQRRLPRRQVHQWPGSASPGAGHPDSTAALGRARSLAYWGAVRDWARETGFQCHRPIRFDNRRAAVRARREPRCESISDECISSACSLCAASAQGGRRVGAVRIAAGQPVSRAVLTRNWTVLAIECGSAGASPSQSHPSTFRNPPLKKQNEPAAICRLTLVERRSTIGKTGISPRSQPFPG